MSLADTYRTIVGGVWFEALVGGVVLLCLVWAEERGLVSSVPRALLVAAVLVPAVALALTLLVSVEAVHVVLMALGFAGPMAMSVIAIKHIAGG